MRALRKPLGLAQALQRIVARFESHSKMKTNLKNAAAIEVNEADFQAQVLECRQPVLVEFWAPWSRPCHVLHLVLNEVAATCAGKAKVVRVNADDSLDLSLCYDIQSVPTLLYFVGGIPLFRIVGTATKAAILAKLETIGGPAPSARRN
jgi:thioredoxin 1